MLEVCVKMQIFGQFITREKPFWVNGSIFVWYQIDLARVKFKICINIRRKYEKNGQKENFQYFIFSNTFNFKNQFLLFKFVFFTQNLGHFPVLWYSFAINFALWKKKTFLFGIGLSFDEENYRKIFRNQNMILPFSICYFYFACD